MCRWNAYFGQPLLIDEHSLIIVSDPVSDLPGARREVPESTALIIQAGPDEHREFRPRSPSDASAPPRAAAAATR